MKQNHHPDSKVIDALGGTFKVAKLCLVKPSSVSDWRKKGIPDARRMFLEVIRPDIEWSVLRGKPLEAKAVAHV